MPGRRGNRTDHNDLENPIGERRSTGSLARKGQKNQIATSITVKSMQLPMSGGTMDMRDRFILRPLTLADPGDSRMRKEVIPQFP